MWKIIRAEYLHTLFVDKLRIFSIIIGVFLLSFILKEKVDLIITYFFAGGIVLALHDDKRFYIFQILPIANKKIAIARLMMLAINYSVLIIVVIPFIVYNQINWVDNLSKLFVMIGILLLARLFSFSLFDITSGYLSMKRNRSLFRLTFLLLPIVISFIYITTIYFKKPELKIMLIALSYSLVPLLAFLSVKTFSAKERILVKEK